MSIKRISSSRLPNEYHLGYMSQTWDIVKDLAVGVDAFTAAKTEFHTAIDGEDAAYKKSLKISTTEDTSHRVCPPVSYCELKVKDYSG